MADIHPTAHVAVGAEIDPTATVGPFAVIGPEVGIGAHTRVGPHVVLDGRTTIGAHNEIGAHAIIGGAPQIRELRPSDRGALEIGDGNCIRELVTVHVGGRGGVTRLGGRNMLMAYSHVAHDCQLGDGVELANGVQLAGHVVVEDDAALGGLAAVHQFVRVGRCAFVGAGSMVSQDVLPYSLVSGDRARTFGLNTVGLRRRGFTPEARRELARALRLLLGAPTLSEGLQRARAACSGAEVEHLLAFAAASRRGLCRGVGRARGDDDRGADEQ